MLQFTLQCGICISGCLLKRAEFVLIQVANPDGCYVSLSLTACISISPWLCLYS